MNVNVGFGRQTGVNILTAGRPGSRFFIESWHTPVIWDGGVLNQYVHVCHVLLLELIEGLTGVGAGSKSDIS